MTETLHFTLDDFHNRTRRDWSRAGSHDRHPCGAQAAAQRHAREHGKAGIWNANDSFVLFYMDGKCLRQKTWQRAAPKRPDVVEQRKMGEKA